MNIILVVINSYICWKKESVQKDYKMTMFPMRKELQENVTLKDISKTLCRFSYSYMDILAFYDTF